ncbi:EEF1A lysine methyltransferase 2 [Microplitis demolitor]|uniref:EEF1A lysine methyltransferase 2 n=1 Tax=Microplitis demolitor TaxID=69319 RepID=UPI0004CD52F6|nr:EEF1A lysine methyltransferase 2 [Microplitis demolitor]
MSDTEELNESELGTLEHWEKIYDEEINNFQEYGDVGEIWFGKNNAFKLIKCIEELNISKSDPIIDLGCGNGWTLLKLYENGFKNLLGVDYSPKAVELARNILKENKIVLDDLATRIEVCDILQDLDSGDGKDKNFLKPRSFKLIHDKGTYDAVSLNPDDRHRQRGKYKTNVWDLLMDNGYLIISSCNWTKDELIQHFSGFKVEKILEAPAIKFGGKVGQSVTNIVFKKISV